MSTSGPIPIAIVGMSCRAAGVDTLADLWHLLGKGEQRFADVPDGRWHGLDPGVPLTNPPRASLLERIDGFDARFFGISPRMAAWMDPQQRMMLELAWQAVENAGLDPDRLAGEPVGVFVGSFMSDYRERAAALGLADSAAFPGGLTAFSANRLSYQFGWTGPSMVVDSACSSSLSALGLAVQGLRDGSIPMALVGAPSIISNGFYANTAYRGGALSPRGDSVPFAAGRDGYVRGEGGACLLLKRLDQAMADGDPVHAVIRSVATTHNGRGGGLTGTDIDSQVLLLRQAARSAGLSVSDIGYLEAHGSGTPSGDAVEVAALARALESTAAGPAGKVWVGSIKANIGHLEAAAGLIGIVKTVLSLHHERIPRVAGLHAVDPELPIGGTDVAIAVDDVPWPRADRPRIAGVSSFGLGGSLAHALLEEPPDLDTTTERRTCFVPLSSRDDDALKALADRLVIAVEGTRPPDLASIAWTMQTARRDQARRLVVVADDLDRFVAALRGIAAGVPDRSACTSDPEAAVLAAHAAPRAWLRGEAANWEELWEGGRPARKAALPGNPFHHKSHWFDRTPPPAVSWT